ncbi:MAG: quinol:electron acceptor oxidoreductase subunit ActD [Gammaproteobacteria bacterium]|nr:quinol:electron acceptor oxidoreductase subunit ActD [Gammaproteobacteria bacterium]
MTKKRMMGLFSDFDEAHDAIADIRRNEVPGLTVDDVTMKSPIEHPEVEEVLGERPVHIQKFTLFGALFGLTFGFLFLSGAQATFLVQPQGGKPVIPLPSNFVLMYEMLIFFGVWSTFFAFLFLSGLFKKRSALYSEKVSLDQVAILVEVDESISESVRALFQKHKVLEIREEVIR